MRRATWLLLVLLAVPAWAQEPPTVNPRLVQFVASPDHAVMLDTYTPAVTGYTLDIYAAGAAAPMVRHELGKPEPAPETNLIVQSFDTTPGLMAWPISVGTVYTAKVTAYGPYGMGSSPPSNEFSYNNQWRCSFSTIPASWTVPPGGGVLSLKITVSSSGCQWNLVGLPPWVTSSLASGTVTTTLTLTAVANDTGVVRGLTLPIGSMRPADFVFTQQPLPSGAAPPRPPSAVVLLP